MPRSRHAATYGPEYEHMLNQAFTAGGFSVPCPTPHHAAVLRGKIYAYFSALRRGGLRPDLVEKAQQFAVVIEASDSGSAVALRPRSSSWDNMLLRSALGLDTNAVPPLAETSQSLLVKRLHEIREKSAKE